MLPSFADTAGAAADGLPATARSIPRDAASSGESSRSGEFVSGSEAPAVWGEVTRPTQDPSAVRVSLSTPSSPSLEMDMA